MKKILLSSAIAAALGTAGVANAAVDLDAATANPLVFAQELTVPAAGLPLFVTTAGSTAGGGLATASATQGGYTAGAGAVQAKFGFTIGQGTSKYVRITLDQPLAVALAPTDFGAISGSAATISVSQGGAAGQDFVVVEVSAPTGGSDILQSDSFVFAPANGKIVALNKNTQSISYALYETAVDAVNQSNALVEKSGEWIKFGPGYTLSCTNENAQINVVDRNEFIPNSATTPVTTVGVATAATLGLTGGVAFKADGSIASLVDYFGNTPSVQLNGSAVSLTSATVGGAVATVAGTPPSFSAVTPAVGTLNNSPLLLTANTTGDMVASTYSLAITAGAGAAADYNVGTLTVDCGKVRYSGSEDRLDFALTPGGVFQQMARITNPSNKAGDVIVTVINDNGEEVSFDLGEIAGVDSTVLGAKASTKLININDIYAAAQAKKPSFALAGTGPDSKNKLRVVVRGEFGGDAVDGNIARLTDRREDGIYIQAVTLSNDGNAFFQTK